MSNTVPSEIRTSRLLIRPWRASDAPQLGPILAREHERLAPWIPARIAQPAPDEQLAERIAGFNTEFNADREWRFAMCNADDTALLGDIGLFPRNATQRVPYPESDRVEIGYWLRESAEGNGYVTEAARAMIDTVRAIPRFTRIEIRCDARNMASAAVPRRLGFTLGETLAREHGTELQVWTLTIPT